MYFFPALRGEAALKARKNATISPYESNSEAAFFKPKKDQGSLCVGELLQLTRKGNLLIEVQDQLVV